MVDFTKKIHKKGAEMLQHGEEVIAACPLQPVGSFGKSVSMTAVGGIAGVAISSRMGKGDGTSTEAGTLADSFPGGNLIIAVTDQRVIAFEQASMSGNPKSIAAEWPRDQVTSMSLEKKKMTFLAELKFADGSVANGEIIKGAKPEKFAAALTQT